MMRKLCFALSVPLCVAACDAGEITYEPPQTMDASAPAPDAPPWVDGVHVENYCTQRTPIQLIEVPAPDLLLVVDKSGSMGANLASGDRKWTVMSDAVNNVLTERQDGVNFGLMTYPTGNKCEAGRLAVDVGEHNAAAIESGLNAVTVEGGTPTHTTLEAAHEYFRGRAVNPSGRFILLATDGEPNCKDNIGNTDSSVKESVEALEALAADGIASFVLGFGDDVNAVPANLQAMAVAGGSGDYFPANTLAELDAALAAIAGYVTLPPCTYELEETTAKPELLTVAFDGSAVERDASGTKEAGWDHDQLTNTITFFGTTCDELQSGTVDSIDVDFSCPRAPIL